MKQPKKTVPTHRNLLHDHPLLRKCAAHGKSRKAERRDAKIRTKREWDGQSRLAA